MSSVLFGPFHGLYGVQYSTVYSNSRGLAPLTKICLHIDKNVQYLGRGLRGPLYKSLVCVSTCLSTAPVFWLSEHFLTTMLSLY